MAFTDLAEVIEGELGIQNRWDEVCDRAQRLGYIYQPAARKLRKSLRKSRKLKALVPYPARQMYQRALPLEVDPLARKTCGRCQQSKPIKCFGLLPGELKGETPEPLSARREGWCRDCVREWKRGWNLRRAADRFPR